MKNQETARALLGSLLLRPGLFVEVSGFLRPDMFPAELVDAASFIWEQEKQGRGYDISSVADAAGWSRAEKNEVIKEANPAIIADHARQVRDAYLCRIQADILEQAAAEMRAGTDPWEALAAMEVLLDRARHGVEGYQDNKGAMIREALQRISAAISRDGLSGITTGWGDLDQMTGGWQPGNLVIIGARPGMGKTTVMMHHARAAANAGAPVAILTLEMTGIELVAKWMAESAAINTGLLRTGAINEKALEKIHEQGERLYELPVVFDDFADTRPTAATIRDRMRLLSDRHGVKVFFIDYLQLINGEDRRQNRNYQIEEISRTMKQTAKQLDATVVALSQLSRAVENRGGTKRPTMADLRDSGSVEQDADMVVLLYRPEYYGIMEDEQGASVAGLLEYRVEKDRAGGVPRTLERWWYGAQYHEEPGGGVDIPDPAPVDVLAVNKKADTTQEIPF